MIERCPYCGTKLKETTWGRKFCPNCGIVNDEQEEEPKEGGKKYIG